MNRCQDHKIGLIASVAGMAVLLLATATMAQWPDWDPEVQLSNNPNNFGSGPHLAIDANDKLHVIYHEFLDNNGAYYYTTNASGSWSSPQLLQSTSGKGSAPKIVITPDDMLHVFYGKGDLFWRTKPVTGGSWSAPVEVAVNPDGGHINHVVVDASGGIYFLWTHLFDDSAPVRSAIWGRYKSLGGSWGSTEYIFGTDDEHKWPQGGNIFVDGTDGMTLWVTYSWNGTKHKKRPPGGPWPGGDGSPLSPWGGGGPVLDWNPTSNELAMTYAQDVDGDADKLWFEIFATFSYDNGATWTTPINISNSQALDRANRMTYDDKGNLFVVWEGADCNGYGCPLTVRGISRIAGAWTPAEVITTTASFVSGDGIKASSDQVHIVYPRAMEVFVRSRWNDFPAGQGTLTGVVRDQHGDPVAGASVHAAGAGVVTSEANGTYTLPLPPYTFDVTASKEFYASDTVNSIAITDGNVVNQDFVITAQPPGQAWAVRASPSDQRNFLSWYAPSSDNYYATVIRYSTSAFPVDENDGTFLTEVYGAPGDALSYIHDNLTNGVTYYYSIFTRDNQTNVHYSAPVQVSGTPFDAPKPNLLTNGSMTTFTGNVATGWDPYVVNDDAGAINFQADSSYYGIDPPSQRINEIDSPSLPDTGLSAAGVRQTVGGTTPGKIYQFGGFQDLFVDDYQADGTRYLINFGIDPAGGQEPAPLGTDGTIGDAKWMTPDQALWNKPIGSPVYYNGFHRSWASFEATGSEVSVWSGVTIDNMGVRDSADAKMYCDSLFLFEWDFPANVGITNAGFEGARIDLQNGGTGGGGDVIPEGWIPAGGGIGEWNNITVDAVAAYAGSYGTLIGHRRGTINGGLMQKITCTPGYEQTFTAWVQASGQEGTQAMIGIDPQAGGDITSPHIVWTGTAASSWTQLSVSAVAQSGEVTLFMKSRSDADLGTGGYHTCYFDEAAHSEQPGPPTGTISGIITDRCGDVLGGATVSTHLGGFSTLSQPDGSYSLTGVYPGTYNVEATKAGYGIGEALDVDVTSGGNATADIMVPDPLTGTITGQVVDDCGDPVSGATVDTETGCYEATTDADGYYTIDFVPVGSYGLVVSAAGFIDGFEMGVGVATDNTTTVDFTVYPASLGHISGIVRDSYGTVLNDVDITITPGCGSATTNLSGQYTLSNIKPGNYTVMARKDGYYPQDLSPIIVSGDNTTTVNFYLSPTTNQEMLLNGDFESGFSHFWGGDMADYWGAVWRPPFPDDNLNPWAHTVQSGHGEVMRVQDMPFGFEGGIAQSVGGLTPGQPYWFSAQAYQFSTGNTAWIAADQIPGTDLSPRSEATQFPNVANIWQTQVVTGVVPPTGTIRCTLWGFYESGTQDEVRFDNASLVVAVPSVTSPVIGNWPASLHVESELGINAESQTIQIANVGSGTLNYSVTDDRSWMSVSPTSGSSTGDTDTLTVQFSTLGLTAGNYTGNITISAGGATNSPQVVTVSVDVVEPPVRLPDFDSDSDVDQVDHSVVQACQTGQSITPPGEGCDEADLDFDEDVDLYDVELYLNCVSGANVAMTPGCIDTPIDYIVPDKAYAISPANGAVDLSTAVQLSWRPGTGAVSHNIHFGTTNPPAYVATQSSNLYDPGSLTEDTQYFWRIDEVNGQGTTTGDVWTFTTVQDPVENLSRYSLMTMEVGAEYYDDRNYTIQSLPTGFDGSIGIKTANDDKYATDASWLSFDLNVEATVYVAYDHRATALPAWMAGYADSGLQMTVTDAGSPLILYEQTFSPGTVTLGANFQPPANGAGSMYSVLIVPTGN